MNTPARSPWRDRPIEESLDLFRRMRAGEFPDNKYTLRAKIDLASGNFNMRDPVIYRIRHIEHHRQGNKWCIYPMYDFAHPIQDALEGITHSLCSLEFEAHRPLYDWVVNNVSVPNKPRQIEFARLGIDHTVMSKRKLSKLVEEGYVSGWDDPRMPTLCGLRRRGYTPGGDTRLLERIGVAKVNSSTVEYALLEHCLREDLNEHAQRAMAVLRPLKLTIVNYPEGQSERLRSRTTPTTPTPGRAPSASPATCTSSATISWSTARRSISGSAPPRTARPAPSSAVSRARTSSAAPDLSRTRAARWSRCWRSTTPRAGAATPPTAARSRARTLHWVDANNCVDAEVRLYSNLFNDADPDAGDKNFLDCLNPDSLEVLSGCKVEPMLARRRSGTHFQFLRQGYSAGTPRFHARASHFQPRRRAKGQLQEMSPRRSPGRQRRTGMNKNTGTIIATIFAVLLLPFALMVVANSIPPDLYSSPVFWASLVIDAVVICTGIVLCRLNRMEAKSDDTDRRGGE